MKFAYEKCQHCCGKYRVIMKIKNADRRDILIYKNALGAFIIKGAALVVSFFMMPAYMRFFEDQQILGVWFTILSVLTWVLNFDLGIGNGLRNKLAVSLAKGDREAAKEYIASAYWMIGLIVSVLMVVGWGIIPRIEWNEVFNVSESLIPPLALRQVVKNVFASITIQFVLRLVSSVLYAMQKSAVNNCIALMTSILQFIFLQILPSRSPAQNIQMLSVAYLLFANVPLILATVIVFVGPMRDCFPFPKCIKRDKAKEVLSLGGLFFACQVLYMIIAGTNEFFISQYMQPDDVVEYQIYNRLFTLGSTVFMLALTPVWSAVSQAWAQEDYVWLQKLNKKLLKISTVASLAELLIIPLLQPVINIWLRDEAIMVNYGYACCFALFGSVMVFQSAVSTLGNGMGRMRIQCVFYLIGVLAKFIIIHVGATMSASWIIIVLTNAIVLLPYCIVQQMDISSFIRKKLAKAN